MKVILRPFVPAVATGLLALSSCTTAYDRANSYMQDRPKEELKEMLASNHIAMIQSKLDSVAYRDVYNTTSFAEDSIALSEFNNIACSVRGGYPTNQHMISPNKYIQKALVKQGLPVKEQYSFLKIISESRLQYQADKWAYEEFFAKKGLMNDSSFIKKLQNVQKKIRPRSN